MAQPKLVFDYTYDNNNFFGSAGSTQRNAIEAAANRITSRLGDKLAAITPSTSDVWNATFQNPNDGTFTSLNNLDISQNAIRVFVGSRSMGSTQYGVTSAGGYTGLNGSDSFKQNVQTRGQAGAAGSPATDYGPWGGSIAFNWDSNWHYDTTTTPPTNKVDLQTVAEHELARILGCGTSPAWQALVSGGSFVGETAFNLYGEAVPLSADMTSWAPGTNLGGSIQLMQSSVPLGRRRGMGELDYAAMSDIGWQVSPVPEPGAMLAVGAACLALLGVWRGRKSSRPALV